MEEHKLAELLRIQSAEVSGQTPFCPEAELIVKHFEGTLIEQEHAGLKRHLAECRFCLARIGNLERLDVSDDDPEAPGTVLADAKRLVKVSSAPRFRHATAWATAAVMVLAVTIAINRISPSSFDGNTSVEQPAPATQDAAGRQSRNINPKAMAPAILAPVEGSMINPETLIFRWSGIPGTLYYDIRIVTDDGALLRQDRVEETQWALPPELELSPGREYFVRVAAYLAEAKSISSRHIVFTAGERR